jgi:PHD/YefM family antitoxin component YafN of YafNO toxin-antitoxin module
MQTITDQEAGQLLPTLIQQVITQHEPLCIHAQTIGKAVLLAEEDYWSLMETLHLLSNPVNTDKLLQAVKRSPQEAKTWDEVKSELGL